MSLLLMIFGAAVVAYLGVEGARRGAARKTARTRQTETDQQQISDNPEEHLHAQWLDEEPERTAARHALQAAADLAATRRRAVADRLREFADLTAARVILVAVMCAGWVAAAVSQGRLDATIFQAVMNGNSALAVLFTVLVVTALGVIPLLFKRVLRETAAGTPQRLLGTIGLVAAFVMIAAFMVQLAPQRANLEFQPALSAAQQDLTIARQDTTDPLPIAFDQQRVDQLLADQQHAAQVSQVVAGMAAAVEAVTGWFVPEGIGLLLLLHSKRRLATAERAVTTTRNDQERAAAQWIQRMSRTFARLNVPQAVLQNFRSDNPRPPAARPVLALPAPPSPAPGILHTPPRRTETVTPENDLAIHIGHDRPATGISRPTTEASLNHDES